MANTNEDIAKILNELASERGSGPKKEEKGEIEFELGSRPIEQAMPEQNIAFEEELKSAKAESDEPNEEAIPNIFEIAQKEDNEPVNESVYRFRATYIPRFTDMDAPIVKEKDQVATVVINSNDAEAVDPTAEIDKDEICDAITVKVEQEADLIDESARVFKFSDSEEERSAPPPAEDPEPVAEAPAFLEEKAPEPTPEPVEKKELNQPKKIEKYVPPEISRVENITNVGDVIRDDGNKREFKSFERRDLFKDKFIDLLLSIKVRFFAAAFLTLVIAVFEALPVFGVDIISFFKLDAVSSASAMIDIQLASCLFLLSLPEIFTALKKLSERNPVSDLFIIPAFCVYLIYTLTLISRDSGKNSVFVGFLFSVFSLAVISSSYFKNSADFAAFKMISTPDDKFIVDNKPTRLLERENIALDGVVEEHKSKTARVFRTSFVADFFNRTAKSAECKKRLMLLAFLPLGVALVVGTVAFFVYDRSYLTGLTSFSVVYLFSLPAFSVLTHKLPFFYATGEAVSMGGAAIGEASMHSYALIDVICFEDTEIFDAEDVNIQRIMLYGNNENLTKALRQMSALFMNVGGPLDIIFSNSLDKKCDPANGVLIKENGISGEMDGMKIMAGSYEYMLSEGAIIPDDGEDLTSAIGSTKTMYAAENGVVYAKFLIRYRFSEEFTMILPTLREERIVPLVYTRDPNVSTELFKTLTAGTNDIRILKKNTLPNLSFSPAKVSAGMVIEGEKDNLVNLVLLSKRYARFHTAVKITERSSMIAALAIGALLSLGGMISPATLPILGIWQFGWCVALQVLSKKSFKSLKDSKKNAK